MSFVVGTIIIILYAISSLYIFFSIRKGYVKKALLFIIILGLILRFFVAGDLYLHEWDERFHAVVAKNIASHPLKPTLYENPILDYDYKDWANNHVWLSKPPLTFWLVGASLTIFGNNEVGLRFPSILISVLCVILTFKIGKILFNQRIGLVAAFLHAIDGTTLELTGGIISADHVDVMFLICVQLCLLFTALYVKTSHIKNLFFIGTVVGCAYLCKWIMSFLLILILLPIFLLKDGFKKTLLNVVIIVIPFLIVSLPWQLFILYQYPQESIWMFKQMFLPIINESDAHKGGILFYVDWLRIMFGELIYLPVIWLTYKCIHRYNERVRKINLWVLLMWIIIPIFFLSISQMKKNTYLMIISPAIYLLTAFFLYYLYRIRYQLKINIKITLVIIFLLIALPIRYSFERIKPLKQRYEYPQWRTQMEQLHLNTKSKKVVLSGEPHYLNAMFYYDFIAYQLRLTDEQIDKLNNMGYTVYENQNTLYIQK